MESSPPPTFDELGLPRDRGQMALALGGTHAPGTRLEFRIGVEGADVEVNRRFVWSLWDSHHVVDRDEVSVEKLGSADPVTLAVELPPRAPATYRLRLKLTSVTGDVTSFLWPVEVPEQRIEPRLVMSPHRLRPGETFTATLHNDGPTELMTGADFSLERAVNDGEWEHVDPFDGDLSVAWPLVGLLVAPGGTRDFRVQVPQKTHPGLHRIVKTVSAETAKVRDLPVVAEFTVVTEDD